MKIPSTYLPHPAARPLCFEGVAVGEHRPSKPQLSTLGACAPSCSQQLTLGHGTDPALRASANAQLRPVNSTFANAITLRATQGKIFLIDLEDHERVSLYPWAACWINSGWYAKTWNGGEPLYLHRLIMLAKPGELVDHVDGNTLDCRKVNMRIVDRRANSINRAPYRKPRGGSRFKGVTKTPNGTWLAKIGLDRKKYRLGCFATEEEAAHAYDDACHRLHGEFARPNFPEVAA